MSQRTPEERQALIERVMAYPLDRVVARHVQDYVISKKRARLHERELKRYLILRVLYPETKFDMWGYVDYFWHTWLMFTDSYYKFCNEVLGTFIHHWPTIASDYPKEPKAVSAWSEAADRNFDLFLNAYEETFGEPAPSEWPRRKTTSKSGRNVPVMPRD
jgi:hypothetical protein